MSKPIRILHVVSELNQGGIENFIMNIYRKIDKKRIQFDFIVHHKSKGVFEDEITSYGGNVYHFSFLDDKNIIKYRKELKNFFRAHKEYKVVHGHLASIGFIYFSIAKKMGIQYRIAHSHGTSTPKSIKGFIKAILFRFFKKNANIYFACSTESGIYMFSKKTPFKVIPNAVDFDRFSYNKTIRDKYRKDYNLVGKFVIGHVGRFTVEKNHEFILDFFNKIVQINNNAMLLLVGDGPLRKKIEDKVKTLGLDKHVIFIGNTMNVEIMYNIMDIFVLPSLFEGLPVTGIEAQVSGLKSFFSNGITKEVSITSLTSFLSIDNSDIWVNSIIESKLCDNRNKVKFLNNNFDINCLCKQLEEYYLILLSESDVYEKEINV